MLLLQRFACCLRLLLQLLGDLALAVTHTLAQLPRPLKYATVLPCAGLESKLLVPTSFCEP